MSNNYTRTIDMIMDALRDLRHDVEVEIDSLIEENRKLTQENMDLEYEIKALEEELRDSTESSR